MNNALIDTLWQANDNYKYLMIDFFQETPKRTFRLFNVKTKKVYINHYENFNKKIHIGYSHKNKDTSIVLSPDELVRHETDNEGEKFTFITEPSQMIMLTFTNEKVGF